MKILAFMVGVIAFFWGVDLIADRLGMCPNCAELMDKHAHGYDNKYAHCHNCGYCTYGIAHNKDHEPTCKAGKQYE